MTSYLRCSKQRWIQCAQIALSIVSGLTLLVLLVADSHEFFRIACYDCTESGEQDEEYHLGAATHIIINYTLLLVSVTALLALYPSLPFLFSLALTLASLLLQVVLCFLESCAGISVVWNVILGFLLVRVFQLFRCRDLAANNTDSAGSHRYPVSKLASCQLVCVSIACALCLLGDTFYFVMDCINVAFLTSLVHFLSVFLGACVCVMPLIFCRAVSHFEQACDSVHDSEHETKALVATQAQ